MQRLRHDMFAGEMGARLTTPVPGHDIDLYDDFCLTPFHPRELEARLKHQFWRIGGSTQAELVEYGSLLLNLETYQASIASNPLDLTYMEYELLKFLAQHPGKVFTRERLTQLLYGWDEEPESTTLEVNIYHLRKKLFNGLIRTVRGIGYLVEAKA